jgi:hypothetical protein
MYPADHFWWGGWWWMFPMVVPFLFFLAVILFFFLALVVSHSLVEQFSAPGFGNCHGYSEEALCKRGNYQRGI